MNVETPQQQQRRAMRDLMSVAMLQNPADPMSFFRAQGKQAALGEFGMSKEAIPAFLSRAGGLIRGLFRRGSKAVPGINVKGRSARNLSAYSNPQQSAVPQGFPPQMLNPEISGALRPDIAGAGSEALRKDMMARAAEAAKNPEVEKGLLSSIPWWGKALGVGALGYGGYQMLKKPEQPQSMQPYYGPGTTAVDPRMMYAGY